MAKEVFTIRFDPKEKRWIQEYADFLGVSFAEFVREAALEAVERANDRVEYAHITLEEEK